MRHTSHHSSDDHHLPGIELTTKCFRVLQNSYDQEKGGFGKRPKFPQPGKKNLCQISFTRQTEYVRLNQFYGHELIEL